MKNFSFVNRVQEALTENGYRCNADGRRFVFEYIGALAPREIKRSWINTLKYAEKIGGCRPGEVYNYPDAQGGTSKAKVCSLYKLPENMVNPYLVCFSGMMTAPLFCMEILRSYAKQHQTLLPFLAIGKSGNKGLYEAVFNREDGIVVHSEYEAYLRIMSLMAPESYVRENQRVCEDVDTAGNFDELYQFAKAQGLKEVTFVLCSGNFSYDKRVLAEGMWILKRPEYADVKINLVIAHCPIFLGSRLPEGHLTEILLGYVAASLGPLVKDTINFDQETLSEKPERYLMPGVAEANWFRFEKLITEYSNMGWPDYMELLYNVEHEEAVEKIILSDLRARTLADPELYDTGAYLDVRHYQKFVGEYCRHTDFLEYLISTTDQRYF